MTVQDPRVTDEDLDEAAQILQNDIIGAVYSAQLAKLQCAGQTGVDVLVAIEGCSDEAKRESLANLRAGGLLVDIDGQPTLTDIGLAAIRRVLNEPGSITALFV